MKGFSEKQIREHGFGWALDKHKMTEKQDEAEETRQKIMKEEDEDRETCEDCGRTEEQHKMMDFLEELEPEDPTLKDDKICKKFVGKKPKGCGKEVDCYGYPKTDGGWKCGQQYLDKEIILCSSCKRFEPKNEVLK